MRAPALLADCLALTAAGPAAGQEAAPDSAPEIGMAGAQEIARGIKAWVYDVYAEQLPPGMAVSLEVDVRPADGHYRATLGDVRFDMVGLGEFDFGTVTSEIVPLTNGRFDTSSRIAERMTVDLVGGPELAVAIGEQRIEGEFDPQLENFTAFDMRIDDVVITAPGEPGVVSLGSLTAEGGGEDVASGLQDYYATMEFRDLLVDGPGPYLSLDRAWLYGRIESLDYPAYLDFYGEYMDIMMPVSAELGPREAGRLAGLFERTGVLFDRFDYEAGLAGLEIREHGERFVLDEAVFRTEGGPFADGLSTLRFGLSVGPMSLVPEDPLVPGEFEFEIAALDIPNPAVWDGMIAMLHAGAQDRPEMLQSIGEDVLAALTESGSRLELARFAVRTVDGWLEAGGAVRTDPDAALRATGTGWLDMGGVNELVSRLAADPGSQPAVAFLTMLQGLAGGEAGTREDGTPYRRLELELSESGELLVNGADISPLLDGLD